MNDEKEFTAVTVKDGRKKELGSATNGHERAV